MRFVQLSDLHIKAKDQLAYGRVDTAAALRYAVRAVLALRQRPALVFISGDLVDSGLANEYLYLRELLAPLVDEGLPFYLMPGNHDDRAALREVFSDHDYLRSYSPEPFMQYVVNHTPLRLIALDTLIAEHSEGELCEARLTWLEKTLREAPNAPTVVLMHHPPFDTLIGHMDEMGLVRGRERLAQIISQHSNVERVLCGHVHRSIDVRFAGSIASTCPSTAHQVSLDLSEDGAAQFEMEPPGFKLHAWSKRNGLVTHTVHIGEWAGPFEF
jgi:3',5'-cyclic-AMP phosphodiesterase